MKKSLFIAVLFFTLCISCKQNIIKELIYVNQLNENDTIIVQYEYLNDSLMLRKTIKYNTLDSIIKKDQNWFVKFNGENRVLFSEKYFNEGKEHIVYKKEPFCEDCIIKYQWIPKYKIEHKTNVFYVYDIYHLTGINAEYSEYVSTVLFDPSIGEIRNTDVNSYSEYEKQEKAFDYTLIKIKCLNGRIIEFNAPGSTEL